MVEQTGTLAGPHHLGRKLALHSGHGTGHQPIDHTQAAHGVEWALQERLKELKCLYTISHLVEQHRTSLEPILQGIVDILPPSWQYPDICCARLTLYDKQYTTCGFRPSDWRQSAEVQVEGTVAGVVEVFYTKSMPDSDEGPFLKEERSLINAVAERIGNIVGHVHVEQQLQAERAALQERVKELNCLYSISRLVEHHGNDVESILQGIAEILPPSWQYPDKCCARLTLYDKSYTTEDFRTTAWKQSANIVVQGNRAGVVEVYYTQEMPTIDGGPFLKEERDLINAVAERTGKVVERIHIEQQSQVDRAALQESNTALRRVLSQIEEEKGEVHEAIADNVDKILMPVLRALDGEIPAQQKKYTALLRKHLEDISSPFINRLTAAFGVLTPLEVEICNLIRDGLTTKEIAQFRHVSPRTIAKQRERIRQKLQLKGEETNLATHLRMFSADQKKSVRFERDRVHW